MKAQTMSREDTLAEVKKLYYNLGKNVERLKAKDSAVSMQRIIEYEDIKRTIPITKTGKLSFKTIGDKELRNIYRDLSKLQRTGRLSVRQVEAKEREYNKYIKSISKGLDDEERSGIDLLEFEGRIYGILDELYNDFSIRLEKNEKYSYKTIVEEMMYEGKSYREIINTIKEMYDEAYEARTAKEFEVRAQNNFKIQKPQDINEYLDWKFGGDI